jgi:uncharacterized repeat protein (TIGR04138 family)
MSIFNAELAQVVKNDPRYMYEAYEFVYQALEYTHQLLGHSGNGDEAAEESRRHVTGPQLLHGARLLALDEFGMMARTVFRLWGIERTDDFGCIIFNLIEAKLMSKTDDDRPEDFNGVYDLDEALVRDYHIEMEEVE